MTMGAWTEYMQVNEVVQFRWILNALEKNDCLELHHERLACNNLHAFFLDYLASKIHSLFLEVFYTFFLYEL